MSSVAIVDEVASRAQQRIALGMGFVVLAITLGVFPYASTKLLELPHISGMYGATVAMLNLATFWLLFTASSPRRSHTVIAAAYLFAGLMALLHVATFPGAVLEATPLFGTPHAASWLFVPWRAGFALFVGWAVLLEAGKNASVGGGWRHGPPWLAIFAATALAVFSQTTDAAALVRSASGARFSTYSLWGSYFAAGVAFVVALAIWRARLFERSIFVWLVFVLFAEATAIWVSTLGGGRYTVAWYGLRIEGVAASTAVLLLLASHFRRVQKNLATAISGLFIRTEALQAEISRRERAESKLAHAEKLQVAGRLGASLAHDLNNILQVITGRIAIVQRRTGDLVTKDLDVVRSSVRKADALTRQLTLLSGRRQLHPSAVDVAQELRRIEGVVRHLLPPDVELVNTTCQAELFVALDPLELEIAVTNLVTNARDAVPTGGQLTIEARRELRDEGLRIAIRVADNGHGIRGELRERLFEPFFTTKGPGKGTGLGLSQVQGFVESTGGTVTLESVPGAGTTVTMLFGAASAPAAADGQLNPLAAGSQLAGLLLLLVDDNSEVRDSSKELLIEAGFVVRTAQSGQEALALLAGGLVPDVLLSDIVMPGSIHGVELVRRAKLIVPKVRAVLVSGYSDVAEQAREQGFPVIPKPYDLPVVLRALASLSG